MRDLFRRWATGLADSAHNHPYRFLFAALLVSVLALWGTTHLRINQDLKAFLPPDAKSVTRLEQLRERIGAQTDLLVAVESPDPKANIAFGKVLAERLAKLKELRFVIFERDISYFERHALLYLPLGELLDVRKKVLSRIKREVAKKLVVDLEDDDDDKSKGKKKDDALAFDPKARVAKAFGGTEKPSSYVQNKDGTLMIIKARPIKQTTDVGFTQQLVAKVKKLIVEANPQKYHPALKARVRGEYAERVAESRSIFGQVVITAVAAALLLLFMIGGFFRSLRSIPIVLIPVIVSVFATFGVGALIYGSFNLATAFIFAVLLGLGVDFAIHALARYQVERRRAGKGTRSALRLSLSSTGAAMFFGAITSIAVFWLLQLGRFRGFSQFGMMAGIGVLLALIATFTLVPALVSAFERCLPSRFPSPPESSAVQAVKVAPTPAPRSSWGRPLAAVLVLLSFGAAGFALYHVQDVGFEYDFNKLGRKEKKTVKKKKQDGADYRTATGQAVSYAPAIVMCRDRPQCDRTTRLLRALRGLDAGELARLRASRGEAAAPKKAAPASQPTGKGSAAKNSAGKKSAGGDDDLDDDDDPKPIDDGPFKKLRAELAGGTLLPEQRALFRPFSVKRLAYMHDYLRGFLSLQAFVPNRQADKLRIIADIKAQVDRKRGMMSDKTRAKIDKWYSYLQIKEPVSVAALPHWVATQFVETDGQKGRFVVIWNGGSKRDYRHTKKLYDVYFDLQVGPGEKVPMAANYFVLAELIDTLKADGPVVLTAAGLAVLISLLILFRSPRAMLLVATPLVASISWLLGLYYLYEIKLNIFSVIVVPLLIGMAVDNGIHVYHRYRETRDIRVVLRDVGGPMGLATATTFVGFSSLLIADHVGVQTLGFAAAVGMLFGLLGAVITLPALLVLIGKWALPRAKDKADS